MSAFARELPSWLASAVIHMALVLLLGVLVFPVHEVFPPDLMMALSAASTDGQAASLQTPAAEAESPVADEPTTSQRPALEAARPAVSSAAKAASQRDTPSPNVVLKAERRISQSKDRATEPLLASADTPRPAQPEIQPSRVRGERGPSSALPGPSEGAARYARLNRPAAAEGVVDRFIQADIGQLRGTAGARAKYAFQQLGSEAIPALIRGLNRSAKISDSCPVLVISRKLDQLLAKTDDPYLLLYALENLGQDVHPRAAHWQQIVSLRNAWLKRHGEKVAALRKELADELKPKRPLEQGKPFSEADADELALAVTHPDAQVRGQVLEAIAARGMAFGNAERFEMAQPLIRQLQDTDLETRRLARKTLVALSGGREMGPSDEEVDRDPAAASAWWRDRWTQFQLTQSLGGGPGVKLVAGLCSSDDKTRRAALAAFAKDPPQLGPQRQVQAARALIRLLEHDDAQVREQARASLVAISDGVTPQTEDSQAEADGRAAEVRHWTRRWDEIERLRISEPRAESLLSMGSALEDRGDRAAAIRYYERLVRDFPATKAAKVARLRLAEDTGKGPAKKPDGKAED